MISKIFRAVAIAAVSLVFASCAKLPLILVEQVGPEISTGNKGESLYYSPSAPSLGSNQEEIINGFLYAGNGPQNDYSIARKYLTVSNSSKWHPSTETLIQSGQAVVLANSGTRIRVKINFDARVDENGIYSSEPGSSRILEFRLLQENGEWRISSAPNLTSLVAPNFAVLFKAVPVYFWDQSFSYLVPDLRWFPTRASLATKLTNALLTGPSQWLSSAVQNIFPIGTKLNINSVTVENGTAAIDLNATALKVPAWKRPYLRSQILATLGSVEGVTQVSISVERTVQSIGSGASGIPESTSTLPVVLTEAGLSHIAGLSLFEINGTKQLVSKQAASQFALSSDESLVALLGGGSVYSYTLDTLNKAGRLIDNRAGLNNPSVGPFNEVWTSTSRAGSELRITDVDGTVVSLPNPFGFSAAIRSLALSAEGSRVAIVHDPVRGVSVDVYAVVRDKNRKVIGLGSHLAISDFGPHAKTISWVDHTSLVSFFTDSVGFQTALEVKVGGPKSVGTRTIQGSAVVTVPGGTRYYLDSSGNLFASKSFGWDRLRAGVLALRMAGQ